MPDNNKGSKNKVTGAKALIRILESLGVDTLFGYPGGANLPIYDALTQSSIRHVLARHEQGAVHMADGFARQAKKPGVCLATSGPGATNLVTGLANAYLDSIPLVALTAQIPRKMIGTDAFQEVDCINITMPVTKHNELVFSEEDLVRSVKSAFYIANTGRKGPVLLDFPKDVLEEEFEYDFEQDFDLPGYNPTIHGNIGQIKRAIKAIKRAERPVILFGGGILTSGAEEEFLRFVDKTHIPVIRTLMGTGVIGSDDPRFLGMIGSHGSAIANKVVRQEADLIVAVGTRFGDRSVVKTDLFAKNAKVIHIDIDPAEIGKNILIDIPIVGDIKEVLADINQRLEKDPLPKKEQWIMVKERKTILSRHESADVMRVICEQLSLIDKKLNISTDVGRHQMWANHYCTNPKHLPLITSGGLGTMGFGLPAAIGAWFAEPQTPVVSISGDGSFMMNLQEFSVAVEYDIPLTVILINDRRLGMIRELQTTKYKKNYIAHELGGQVDFIRFAESMGGQGMSVHHPSQIHSSIKRAIESKKPMIVEFDLEKIDRSSALDFTAVS